VAETVAWYDIRHYTAALLDDLVLGTATGGSTTTLIDTADRYEQDDTLNGMFVKIYSGTGLGKERLVNDYVQSTSTITIGGSAWTAPIAGSLYELHSRFSAAQYDVYCKMALRDLTRRCKLLETVVDESLTAGANDYEHNVPAGVVAIESVEVANATPPDGTGYDALPWDAWDIRRAATRVLTLDKTYAELYGLPTTGRTIRVIGWDRLAMPTLDADTYLVNPEPIALLAASYAAGAISTRDPSGVWRTVADRLALLAREAEARIPGPQTGDVRWVEVL
jgi:hypothetical protein